MKTLITVTPWLHLPFSFTETTLYTRCMHVGLKNNKSER